MRAASLAALLGSAFLASCVQLSWTHDTRYEPIPPAALARLVPHETDVGQCLALLGAPLWVWEDSEQGRDGAALAYGWFDERAFGVNVSVPITHDTSASLDYARAGARMQGVVLFFDADWKLVRWRQGLLRDLTEEARRPPAAVEEGA